MARLKRFSRRYGKITLASLGGALMTTGMFLIVLSATTVPQVASASTTGCQAYSSPQPFHTCTPVYYEGSIYYYDCCQVCDTMDYSYNGDPDYDCTDCRDETGDGVPDVCNCCTATQPPPPPLCGPNAACTKGGSQCHLQTEISNGYCAANFGTDCNAVPGCPCTCDGPLGQSCACQ